MNKKSQIGSKHLRLICKFTYKIIELYSNRKHFFEAKYSFKIISTDLGHCCSFNLLPAVLHWDIGKSSDKG